MITSADKGTCCTQPRTSVSQDFASEPAVATRRAAHKTIPWSSWLRTEEHIRAGIATSLHEHAECSHFVGRNLCRSQEGCLQGGVALGGGACLAPELSHVYVFLADIVRTVFSNPELGSLI
jgi:hypothetical protein